jgi:hypothetical protein
MSKHVVSNSLLSKCRGLRRYVGVLITASAVVLGACQSVESRSVGYLEVLPSLSQEAACETPAPGQLQLGRPGESAIAVVRGEELCRGGVVTRGLPAGLYSISWRPERDDDTGKHWELGGAAIVNIFPGQVTRLHVRQIAGDRTLLSRAP